MLVIIFCVNFVYPQLGREQLVVFNAKRKYLHRLYVEELASNKLWLMQTLIYGGEIVVNMTLAAF